MGVYGQAIDRDEPPQQHDFNGGAGLSLIQDDRLVVGNAPLVQDMGVGADGVVADAWINTGISQPQAGFNRHHVAGGQAGPPLPITASRYAAEM